MSHFVTNYHARGKSLPPCEANGNKTGAIGPLACIEGVLLNTKISRMQSGIRSSTYPPPVATQRNPTNVSYQPF
jgi:hypothetical protein